MQLGTVMSYRTVECCSRHYTKVGLVIGTALYHINGISINIDIQGETRVHIDMSDILPIPNPDFSENFLGTPDMTPINS